MLFIHPREAYGLNARRLSVGAVSGWGYGELAITEAYRINGILYCFIWWQRKMLAYSIEVMERVITIITVTAAAAVLTPAPLPAPAPGSTDNDKPTNRPIYTEKTAKT